MKIQKSQKNNCAHHEVLLSAHYPPNLSCPLYILLSCAHQIASPSRRLALGNPLCGRHLHLHPHNLNIPWCLREGLLVLPIGSFMTIIAPTSFKLPVACLLVGISGRGVTGVGGALDTITLSPSLNIFLYQFHLPK